MRIPRVRIDGNSPEQESIMETYTVHSDPGHAWIEVPKAELEALNIADKITPFSYMKGNTAYLEEDCDLSTFFRAMEASGSPMSPARCKESFKENTPIRNYDAYKADAFITKDAFASLFIKETMAAYRDGSFYIEALVDSGFSTINKVPTSEYIAGGCEIISITEASNRIEALHKKTFSSPWVEITEKDYYRYLGELPPELYECGCFRCEEYTTSNYTAHYIVDNGKYYTATRETRPTWDLYRHELAIQLTN